MAIHPTVARRLGDRAHGARIQPLRPDERATLDRVAARDRWAGPFLERPLPDPAGL